MALTNEEFYQYGSFTIPSKITPYQSYPESLVDLLDKLMYETRAGCLRSIYPSLGMRQLFGDVTMGQWRHN